MIKTMGISFASAVSPQPVTVGDMCLTGTLAA